MSAQTATLTLNSATLTIDPQAGDGYALQGTFTGLSFSGVQSVTFSVGQFTGLLLISDFVQQPGTNVFTYQDATGTAPSWLSSLTLDLDAGTFNAQASGITLAGLPNPFAVEIGNESASACSMARVQPAGPTTFQLTPGDGVQEPCQMPAAPQASMQSFFVNESVNVKFHVMILPTPNLDPASVQLFQVDSNGQPAGAPLCNLRDSGAASDGDPVAGDGTYSCIVPFTQSAPGAILVMAQATAGPNQLLSPASQLLVVEPVTQADIDAITGVQAAASAAWQQNLAAYGNSFQARAQTMNALQGMAGVAQIRLLEDGLSIGILYTSGVRGALVLNRYDDTQGAPAPGNLPGAALARVAPRRAPARGLAARTAPAATGQSLACDTPQRPIVRNNQVMIWDSNFFAAPRTATLAQAKFNTSSCPNFTIQPGYSPDVASASIANAKLFPQYGTIIIDTHGAPWGGDVLFVTSDPAILPPKGDPFWNDAQHGWIGGVYVDNAGGTTPSGSYFVLFSGFFQALGPYQNTIVFASTCFSAYGPSMSNAFASNGGAYYGFDNSVSGSTPGIVGFADSTSGDIFDLLLSNNSASDAYQSVAHEEDRLVLLGKGITVIPRPILAHVIRCHFLLQNDPNNKLAYVGNPHLELKDPLAASQDSQILAAYLEGTEGCGLNNSSYLNVKWMNPAQAGHLTPQTPLVTGDSQDNFTNQATDDISQLSDVMFPDLVFGYASAQYQPAANLPATSDNVIADFYPDLNNPVAARGCLNAHGGGLFVNEQLAAIWDDQVPQIPGLTQFAPAKKITGVYTVPLSDPGGYASKGAKASVTVTPTGPNKWTLTVIAGGADPNFRGIDPHPGSGPFQGRAQIGLGAINPGPPGKAMVKISGQVNNQPFCETPPSFPQVCTAADGSIVIGDSQGKTLLNGSLYLGDKNALGPMFSVTADSSCSGIQSTPQCPNAASVGVGISLTESAVAAPTPASFSVTMTIEFVNQ